MGLQTVLDDELTRLEFLTSFFLVYDADDCMLRASRSCARMFEDLSLGEPFNERFVVQDLPQTTPELQFLQPGSTYQMGERNTSREFKVQCIPDFQGERYFLAVLPVLNASLRLWDYGLEPGSLDGFGYGAEYAFLNEMFTKSMSEGLSFVRKLNVRNRELELQQQEMEMKNDLLRMRSEDIETLISALAHDIRGPIANAQALTRLMEQATREEDRLELFGKLKQALHQLEKRHQVVSEIARQEFEVSSAQYDFISIRDLMDKVERNLPLLKDAAQAYIRISCDSSGSIYTAERGFLEMMRHLIRNSLKFAQPGTTPEVSISASFKNDNVVVHYQDNSKGFDLKALNPFERFRNSLEQEHGFGEGLRQVHAHLRECGARVELQSEPGAGVDFRFTFRTRR